MYRLVRQIKDPFPSLSHLAGALLSVAALVVLLNHTHGSTRLTIGLLVYGLSLIALFTASAMTHGIHCCQRTSDTLDKFDYGAIFLLIAGTYTPICLVTLRGHWGMGILIAEWTMAGIGLFDVIFSRGHSNWFRVAIYAVMGWMVLLVVPQLRQTLPLPGLLLLLAGGAVYSVGAVIFALNRPHLWRGVFNAHDLWHVLVLAGSACFFVLILKFVAG